MEALKQKKIDLYTKKKELQDELQTIERELNKTTNHIVSYCLKTTGHKLISERESGIYGETFTYCELCDYEV